MISVVIPAYNAAATIADAVASVEAQTFRDIEIIVVDDASSDSTSAIAKERLQVSGIPFRVLCLPINSGPAAARNRGIAGAVGEWIAFLDADDVWLPARLAVQVAAAAECPEVALWCGLLENAQDTGRDSGRVLGLEEFTEHNPVATSTVLVRKTALVDVGGFDEQFRGPEDYDLWIRLVARHPARHLATPLAQYRCRSGGLSMDERRFLPQALRVLDKAFGPAGALRAYPERQSSAVANQYWNASWMAFQRRARGTALRYWAAAWWRSRTAARPLRRPWLRLLFRYLVTRPTGSGPTEEDHEQ